jgi:hypothetical protein
MLRPFHARVVLTLALLIPPIVYFAAHVAGDEGAGDPRANEEATPNLDLATDTNNNGTIETSEDEYEEWQPGRVLCLNRAGDGPNLYDLAPIILTVPPVTEGTITLNASDNTAVKLWRQEGETMVPHDLPVSWPVAQTPTLLYVEGLKIGAVMIEMTYDGNGNVSPTSDQVALYVTETISWSPRGPFVRSWEPCQWPESGRGGLVSVATEAVLDAIRDQGFGPGVVYRYIDQTPPPKGPQRPRLARQL